VICKKPNPLSWSFWRNFIPFSVSDDYHTVGITTDFSFKLKTLSLDNVECSTTTDRNSITGLYFGHSGIEDEESRIEDLFLVIKRNDDRVERLDIAYADERKKHIDELETYKKEFLVSFKRDLNDAALEVVDEVRKSYKGMFWKTLIIAYACMLITTTAVYKIFGDAYAWLAIVGILLVGVDFCVWVYRYSKMFGSK
jgi:hypothetical protein